MADDKEKTIEQKLAEFCILSERFTMISTRFTKTNVTTPQLITLATEMLSEAELKGKEGILYFRRHDDGGYQVSVYQQ